jgi:hypothetical protein
LKGRSGGRRIETSFPSATESGASINRDWINSVAVCPQHGADRAKRIGRSR